MTHMAGDFTRTPQGSSGSGGLSGGASGSANGVNGDANQDGGYWAAQQQYAPSPYAPTQGSQYGSQYGSQQDAQQYSQQYSQQYPPYDNQRAFAVTAAPDAAATAQSAAYNPDNAAGNA